MSKKLSKVVFLLFICLCYNGYSQTSKADLEPKRGSSTKAVPANAVILDFLATEEKDLNNTSFTWMILNIGTKEKANAQLKKLEVALQSYGANFEVISFEAGNVKFKANFSSTLDMNVFSSTLKNQGIPYTKTGKKTKAIN